MIARDPTGLYPIIHETLAIFDGAPEPVVRTLLGNAMLGLANALMVSPPLPFDEVRVPLAQLTMAAIAYTNVHTPFDIEAMAKMITAQVDTVSLSAPPSAMATMDALTRAYQSLVSGAQARDQRATLAAGAELIARTLWGCQINRVSAC